jgi:hypothetical protein
LDEEAVSVLSIGSIEGGSSPWMKEWRDALQRLSRRVVEVREGISAPINLNVVYHVPGDILEPDFAGVRTGRFSTRDRHLMVQVALPSEPPDDDIDAYLRLRLREAVECAEAWANAKRIAGDLSAIRSIADAA